MSQAHHYFTGLNYTLANEDTALELEILPENILHLFAVAGSGSRILPLLAKQPKTITCVDVSEFQLYLCELRFESMRVLTHAEFLAFWGYPPRSATSEERRSFFEKIKLSKQALKYFKNVFKQNNWSSILYDGKWERTFSKLSGFNRKITGAQGAGLFHALTEAEQANYLKKSFPKERWRFVLFLLGNAGVFNALLYRGQFPKKNIPISFYQFYLQAFDRLFAVGLARENFFLQLVFFGKIIFAEGCPVECNLDVFSKAKAALSQAEIRYVQGDVIEQVKKSSLKIDFLSFSDVPSYFSGEREKLFLQEVGSYLSTGALVVIRNYLHVPQGLVEENFDKVTDLYSVVLAREKVQVYLTDIYRRLA